MRTTERLELDLLEGSDPLSWAPLNENAEKLEAAVEQVRGDKLDSAVGDVLFTVRGDLGEEWLLCDGSTVQAADYPALAGALSPGLTETDTIHSSSSGNIDSARPRCLDCDGTLWVAGGARRTEDGKYHACIAWAESPDGTWTFVDLTSSSTASNEVHVAHIAHGGGVWCALLANGKVFYTEDPAGVWTKGADVGGTRRFLSYVNGYWVVGGGTYNSESSPKTATAYLYWSEVLSADWVRVKVDGYSASSNKARHAQCAGCKGVVYQDGYYYAVCGAGHIYRAEQPTGSWTRIGAIPAFSAVTASLAAGLYGAQGMGYADGVYLVWGALRGGNGEPSPVKAEWALHPAGPWHDVTLWNGLYNEGGVSGGFVTSGMCVVTGAAKSSGGAQTAMAAWTVRGDKPWEIRDLWSSSYSNAAVGAAGGAFGGGYLAALGLQCESSGGARLWDLAWGGGATRSLPNVTGTVPAYIKAK